MESVDKENGNYDYLMYADIDFKHPGYRKSRPMGSEMVYETAEKKRLGGRNYRTHAHADDADAVKRIKLIHYWL